MKDIATFSRAKFIVEGLLRIPLALALLGVALIVVPLMVREEVQKGHATWSGLGFGIFPLLFGYALLSSALRRLTAAFGRDFWMKAGPEGIAFRLPYGVSAKTLFLVSPVVERTIPWADVLETSTLQYKVNGIPFGQAFILKTRQGRFNLGGYFKESAPTIVESLKSAR